MTESLLKPIQLEGRDHGVIIDTPIALAPMAGVTDRPFRNLCHRFGAGLVVTEMVSSKPELQGSRKSRLRQIAPDDPEPRSVQLLGNEPADMADAARMAVDQGAQIVDINMGCPAKKVCRKAAGSALMAEPDTIAAILEAVVGAVGCPVTLKIRTGLEPRQRNAVEIARIAETAGISMLSIHGRTRADKYLGRAEYDTIARVVETVSLPVLANGDIDSPDKAVSVLARTGAAGIMVGRGAFGRPWLFAELKARLMTHRDYEVPTLTHRFALVRDQFEQIYGHYGNSMGPRIARKHLGWYASGLGIDDAHRSAFNHLETPEQQRTWLDHQRTLLT